MACSINTEPLLKAEDTDDFEYDLNESDIDDIAIAHSHEESLMKHQIPIDRYNLAYMVFYLLGVNALMPWSFFITADDYWMYKLRLIKSNESHSLSFSHFENAENRTDLQASFTSYISISSAIPNTVFLIINTFINKRISLSKRMIGSQCLVLVIFILTTSFARVNTDNYQHTFLLITLTCVGFVNAASAIFGGSLLGIVGKFSSKYITAVSAGQALGGIFAALTEILSLWIGASPVVSGLLYFIIGDCVILLSLIAYVILEREIFFKHHVSVKIEDEVQFSVNNETSFCGENVSYLRILKRIWQYGLSMFLIFFITMIVYPSVTVLIESQGKGHGHHWNVIDGYGIWDDNFQYFVFGCTANVSCQCQRVNYIYFVPVVTYLLFSCGDYFGRILSGFVMWPRDNSWLVVLLSLSRICFIPMFLVCNAQPRHNLPVYIHDDVYYIFLTILFAISNGYLCNVVFMVAPTVVDKREKEVASAMLGAFLGIGVSVGSPISLIMVKIL